jgi:hypothetical protein
MRWFMLYNYVRLISPRYCSSYSPTVAPRDFPVYGLAIRFFSFAELKLPLIFFGTFLCMDWQYIFDRMFLIGDMRLPVLNKVPIGDNLARCRGDGFSFKSCQQRQR